MYPPARRPLGGGTPRSNSPVPPGCTCGTWRCGLGPVSTKREELARKRKGLPGPTAPLKAEASRCERAAGGRCGRGGMVPGDLRVTQAWDLNNGAEAQLRHTGSLRTGRLPRAPVFRFVRWSDCRGPRRAGLSVQGTDVCKAALRSDRSRSAAGILTY